MSLIQGLSNATSGLGAAARMASVISANLANALTEGYGRRSVLLSAQTTGLQGAGVQVDAVLRHVDRALQTDRRGAESDMAGQDFLAKALLSVEGIWTGTGTGDGIAAQLSRVDQALLAAVGDPASDQALGQVVQALKGFAGATNTGASTLQAQRAEADRQIADDIATLNAALLQLEASNEAIAKATYANRETTALMDARQQIVDRIAAIVPIRELDRAGNQIALVTTGGEVLIDGKARQYGFTPSAVITADMSLALGSLSGLTRDGVALGGAGFGHLGGGRLEAAFTLRDTILPEAAAALDAFAHDMITRFAQADQSQGGSMAALLGDGTALVPAPPLAGLAQRLQINAALDPGQGGNLHLLRDGFAAPAAAEVGDSRQLSLWRQGLGQARALATGGPATDALGHAARLAGQAGQARIWAEDQQTQSAARWSSLRNSELAMGVDSDAELQLLLRVEQAYAANARVISAIDEMFSNLLRI